MRIQVRDFMTSPVTAAEGKISIGEIRTLMQQKEIHALPIVYTVDDEISIRGIVTSTDLCCQVDDNIPVEVALRFTKVYVVPPNTGAKSAAEMMLKHNLHHIVVMENGKLVGMISSLDFVKLVSLHVLDNKKDKVS